MMVSLVCVWGGVLSNNSAIRTMCMDRKTILKGLLDIMIYYKCLVILAQKSSIKKKVRLLKTHLGYGGKSVCGPGKEEVTTHSCRCACTAGCPSRENKEGQLCTPGDIKTCKPEQVCEACL